MDNRYKIAIVFVILSAFSFIWFRSDHLIYQTDTTFPFSPLMDLNALFYLWTDHFFGGTNLGTVNISYFSLIYIVSKVSNIYVADAVYYYLFVFTSGISTYYLTSSLFLKKASKALSIVPYISSISYMYSSYWISDVFQDPTSTFVFYALLPLFILSLNKIMLESEEKVYFGIYNIIFIGSIFLFMTAFYSPYLLLLVFIVLSYILFYMLANFNIRHFKRIVTSLLILTAGTISSMAYFILPNFVGASATLTQVSAGPFVSTLHYWTYINSHGLFYSLLNNGLGIGSEGSGFNGWSWLKLYTSVPFFIIINVTIPIFAFSSLLFVRKFKLQLNKSVWFFYFLAAIGIILQAGFKGPTGSIYNWLFYHIVFIRAFDSLHLWYSPIIYLSYSILVGVFVFLLIESLKSRSIGTTSFKWNRKQKSDNFINFRINEKVLTYTISFVILIIVMIPSYPVLDGSAVPHGVPSAEVKVPPYVMQASNYLSSMSNISTVLAMPIFMIDYEESYPTGGYFGTNPLLYLLKDPIIYQLNGLSGIQVNYLTDLNVAIYDNNDLVANYYLSLLNIKFILVLADYNSTYFPILTPFSINNTLNMLSSDPNITLAKEYAPFYIYEYKAGNSLVYSSISINNNNETQLHGSNLISNGVLNYWYVNWGNKYSNVTLTPGGLSVYFNYTKGITWPFIEIKIYNISRSIEDYNKLMLDFISSPNTTVTVQANTYQNTHLWLTGESTGGGLILNTSYNEISELQLFLGPANTTNNSFNYFLIKGIVPISERMNPEKYSIAESIVPENQSLSDIKIVNIQYNNPTSIVVNVDVSSPSTFTLVFSQNYNSNWKIRGTSGANADHIIVNNFMNAWVISFSHAGNFSIHLIFESSKVINYFAYLSISSSVLLVVTCVAMSIRRKK